MKRLSLLCATAAGLVACLVPAGAATAKVVELGQTSTPVVAPQCPKGVALSNCFIVLTHTTALQTRSDGISNPTKVKQDGWVVAFTVGLSKLTSDSKTERSLLHTLDTGYGGTPQLAISVLRPTGKNAYKLVAQSGTYHLIPFLGQVLQEPLALPPKFSAMTALPVKKGDLVGLTVPTWAPVLTYNLSASKFTYRQSRRTNCDKAAGSQTAQTTIGASAQYLCSYTGTRVQYTVTEVVNQGYPKTYVHARRQP